MIAGHDTTRENLTLSEADLAACRPLAGEGGHVLRALCPFHGSDHQRSLRVTVASGRFVCFACGAWGYLAEARERWQAEQQRQRVPWRPAVRPQQAPRQRPAAAAVKLPAPAVWARRFVGRIQRPSTVGDPGAVNRLLVRAPPRPRCFPSIRLPPVTPGATTAIAE